MKTLLSILTLSAMILIFNSLAFAITLQTPLVYNGHDQTGYTCAAVNLGDSFAQITVKKCWAQDEFTSHMTCYDYVLELEPGEMTQFHPPRIIYGCKITHCKFTFQGNPDKIKAGMTIIPGHIFIPAE